MTWKMVESNGFKQQQEFRKRGKEILEYIVNEKKEDIEDVLERKIQEAIEDPEVQDKKKKAQNSDSFSTTLYLQKVVEEVGKNLPSKANDIIASRNHNESRFKSVDLPELSLNTNLQGHKRNLSSVKNNKYPQYSKIDDYSIVEKTKKLDYLPSVLNRINPKSTRNESQSHLQNKRGSSHALVSVRSYQSKLKLDKNRDNQNFEKSFE